jgi:hypothetical protein
MRVIFEFDDKAQTVLQPEAVQIFNIADKEKGTQMTAVGYKVGNQMVPVILFPGTFFNAQELADFTDQVKKAAKNTPRNNSK